MQDVAVVAESITTTAGGVTIGSGGSLSMASGAIKIPSGSISMASGASLSLASGAVLVAPSINVGAPGSASVSVAVASGTSVPISQGIVRVSATASTTSTTLAAGTLDGQVVVVVNESANQVIITGNTKTAVTIAASSAVQYVWLAQDTLWWHLT